MSKIFLTIAFLTTMLNWQKPITIQGKWIVDKVEMPPMKQNTTPKQQEQIKNFLIKPFTNSVFEFNPDHHFYWSANIPNMPKGDYWEYDDADKLITIKKYNKPNSVIMKITIVEKDGIIYFNLQESPIALKVHEL